MESDARLAALAAWLPGAGAISAEPGAYALLLRLDPPVRFSRARLGGADLAGWHVYAGSANGPGGIAARVARHQRPGKAVRWHIDELTNAARVVQALALPGGGECGIVATLLGSGRFRPALVGFGSSDCRVCAAHLLKWDE